MAFSEVDKRGRAVVFPFLISSVFLQGSNMPSSFSGFRGFLGSRAGNRAWVTANKRGRG